MSVEPPQRKGVLHCGDARGVVKTLADNSVDSLVGDPPYALVSIVSGSARKMLRLQGARRRLRRLFAGVVGFMGKTWDTGETAF